MQICFKNKTFKTLFCPDLPVVRNFQIIHETKQFNLLILDLESVSRKIRMKFQLITAALANSEVGK